MVIIRVEKELTELLGNILLEMGLWTENFSTGWIKSKQIEYKNSKSYMIRILNVDGFCETLEKCAQQLSLYITKLDCYKSPCVYELALYTVIAGSFLDLKRFYMRVDFKVCESPKCN